MAAFDHRHIFIDPDPDPARSWEERAPVQLPRSSWDDYDRADLAGGGFRSAKSITLSPEAPALDIGAETPTPTELIRAILTARSTCSLQRRHRHLREGKAASQTDAAVGDRANDAVRVNGGELRCKVVGEGGNLAPPSSAASSSRSRAGASTPTRSTILAGRLLRPRGQHQDPARRGDRRGRVTLKAAQRTARRHDRRVGILVLRDNYAQTQVLSVTRARGVAPLDEQAEFIRRLGAGRAAQPQARIPARRRRDRPAQGGGRRTHQPRAGGAARLQQDRALRRGARLRRAGGPYIRTALERYFPAPLRERFPAQIQIHPLRREIISTHVVNSMINRVGPTFVSRLRAELGASAADVVRAYMATREVFGLVALWRESRPSTTASPTRCRPSSSRSPGRLVQRGTLWFRVTAAGWPTCQATLAHFSPGVAALAEGLADHVAPPIAPARRRGGAPGGQGVPRRWQARWPRSKSCTLGARPGRGGGGAGA